jgi:hypothetical protein
MRPDRSIRRQKKINEVCADCACECKQPARVRIVACGFLKPCGIPSRCGVGEVMAAGEDGWDA